MKQLFICSILFSLMLSLALAEEKAPAPEGHDHEVVTVASIKEMEDATKKAKPGTTIVLKDGTYDGNCSLSGKGTKEAPIVVRAETIGGVHIGGGVAISGEYLSFMGFRFRKVGVNQGIGCRVSRCHTKGSNEAVVVNKGARNVEIDHCLFEDKPGQKGVLCRIESTGTGESHHIHHNHFRDVAQGEFKNGGETMQLYNRDNRGHADAKGSTGNVVEYNVFERCDGDPEIISVKSSGNTLRGNTFRNCRAELVLRQGDRNLVVGNWFLEGNGGLRMAGTDHVVINNYFVDLGRGLTMMDGSRLYPKVERALVAHNTFINCGKAFFIGQNHSQYPEGTVPQACVIANNLMVQNKDVTNGLIFFNNDQEPEKWIWKNNFYHGKLGISEREGLQESSAFQIHDESKLLILTKATPTAGRADLTWPKEHDKTKADKVIEELNVDLEGATRPETGTVGAFQFTGKPITTRPLVESDVGPLADQNHEK